MTAKQIQKMAKSKLFKKVWGSEEWLVNNDNYCGKILTLNPGFQCSYHYHKKKDETFYVLEGLVYLKLEGEEIILHPSDSQRILPGQRHQFASLDGISKLIEISTHHEEDDSYRESESDKINLDELRKRLGL